jgi:phage terminase small subunit
MDNNQVPDILGGIDGGKKAPDFNDDQLKAFILCYMDTADPLAAAIRAGLQNAEESVMTTADRLMRHPAVKAGIAAVETLTRDGQVIRVTRDSLVEDCQAVKEKALTDRQYTSTLGAIKLQAQLKGFLEEKVRVTHQYDPKKMSDEELERIASNDKAIDVPFETIPNDPQ